MCNPPVLSPSFESLSSQSSSTASHYTSRKPTRGRGTYRSMYRNDHDDEPGHYFLDSCFLCGARLHSDDDVYMYRGDIAFCSEECRQDQIEIDEADEKRRNRLRMSKKSKFDKNDTPNESEEIHVRLAAIVIA